MNPNFDRAGMLRSSMKATRRRPPTGAKTPLVRFSSLPSMVSWGEGGCRLGSVGVRLEAVGVGQLVSFGGEMPNKASCKRGTRRRIHTHLQAGAAGLRAKVDGAVRPVGRQPLQQRRERHRLADADAAEDQGVVAGADEGAGDEFVALGVDGRDEEPARVDGGGWNEWSIAAVAAANP
jgi:hypothetical protein